MSQRAASRSGFLAEVDRLESRELLSSVGGREFARAQATRHRLNVLNQVYTKDASGSERLDLHVPGAQAPAGGWPMVVVIHGGGWTQGDKFAYEQEVDSTLNAAGFAVVAPDYTLSSPRHSTWPTNLDELRQAVAWARTNAARYDLNPAEVAAMGESAGGQLALLLGTDPTSAADRVNAVVDFYGPTDLAAMEEDPAAAGAFDVSQYLGGTPQQIAARYAQASPVTHVSPRTPPVLIVQGTADAVVPYSQSVELAGVLNARGVPNQFLTIPGAPHGFSLNVDGLDLGPTVTDFLRQTLTA